MKKSIISLLKEFDGQPKHMQKLFKKIFDFENDKMYVKNPQYKSDYKRIIDSIVDQEFNK